MENCYNLFLFRKMKMKMLLIFSLNFLQLTYILFLSIYPRKCKTIITTNVRIRKKIKKKTKEICLLHKIPFKTFMVKELNQIRKCFLKINKDVNSRRTLVKPFFMLVLALPLKIESATL